MTEDTFTIDAKLGLKGKREGPLLKEAFLIQLPENSKGTEFERLQLAEDIAYINGAQNLRYIIETNSFNRLDEQKQYSFVGNLSKALDFEMAANHDLYKKLR